MTTGETVTYEGDASLPEIDSNQQGYLESPEACDESKVMPSHSIQNTGNSFVYWQMLQSHHNREKILSW